MQTFLPFADFEMSAKVLDRKRLGKQRVEAYQIIRTLLAGEEAGWAKHPAVLMWKGHGIALLAYLLVVIDEWEQRGYKDSVRGKVLEEVSAKLGMSPEALEGLAHEDILRGESGDMYGGLPVWLGDEAFHASHRSALLEKDPEWYSQFGWTDTPGIDYVWPVRASENEIVEEGVAAPAPSSTPIVGEGEVSAASPSPTPDPEHQTQGENTVSDKPAESAPENYNREQIVDALRGLGWDGPVSYSKTRLVEMHNTLQAGGTIEVPKRGRASADKESSPVA